MTRKLHIDIETYSSVDIRKSGAYKYCESIDFEILMVAYAFDDKPIKIVDLTWGQEWPTELLEALENPEIEKHAHNANFERNAFKAIGVDIPIEQWHCSAVKAAYCGLPFSLGMVSEALNLGEKGKLTTGKALIRYFCIPCKPTKTNGGRMRNMPHHDIYKWEEFKQYCINDVEAEREIDNQLLEYSIPEDERKSYILDQEINDRGVRIDSKMVENVLAINAEHEINLRAKMVELTGLANPNSPAQLKQWLGDAMQKEIKSLAKDELPKLIEEAGSEVVTEVLDLRKRMSKTSIKKYAAMQNCECEDGRAHGLFQFYGANRTGRWAGRLIQLQNLPKNHIPALEQARTMFANRDYDTITMLYDDVSGTMSQLIRTALIAKPDHLFAVADFSAIEARVIAWIAGEKWRMDIFATHGKIYEASAALMFNVPIEAVTKGSDYRAKAKIAELALGYQGALGALKKMGGESMGLSDHEMEEIVNKWRAKNKNITKLWRQVGDAAKTAVLSRRKITLRKYKNLAFESNGKVLTIQLPSGRKLFYQSPAIEINKFGQASVKYMGVDSLTKKWGWISSYGGKFVENIVQAVARDILADSMLSLDKWGFKIAMHVHDEAICEVPKHNAFEALREMCLIMAKDIPWAEGLPLAVDGYITPFYKKD